MTTRSWIRNLFARPAARPIRKAPPRSRLALEVLEDRWCPSTFVVDNPTDTPANGKTDLRQAIALANSTAGADSITFDSTVFATAQTITLTSGQLTLTDAATTTIIGPGANLLSISGNNASSVFGINSGKSAALSGLTITDGNAVSGGGVNNLGTATLTDCTVTNNTAGVPGGGGVFSTGNLTLKNCTISGNTAGDKGGGVYAASGTALLDGVTLSNNHAAYRGGGFSNQNATASLTNCTVSGNTLNIGNGTGGAGVFNRNTTTTLTNCTITGNVSPGGFQVSGVFNLYGTVALTNCTVSANGVGHPNSVTIDNLFTTKPISLANTIVAGNVGFADVAGLISSQGNNLIGKVGATTGWLASDQTGTFAAPLTPLLAPLGNYGGPTQTMALLPGSPAIDAGNNNLFPTGLDTDQRGFARFVNGTVDIGAFEVQKANITVTPYSVTYDTTAHTATGTATGSGGVDLSAYLNLLASTHTSAGAYSDGWTFHDPSGIYPDASGTVTDVIGQAPANITVAPYSVTYDATAHTATGTATGVGSIDLSAFLSFTGTTHTSAGTYTTDTWSFHDANGNYADASGTVTDTIGQGAASLSELQTIDSLLGIVPGGIDSTLGNYVRQVAIAMTGGDAPAAKAALDQLTSEAASEALSGALGTDPAVAFATAQALFEPISFLQVAALQAVGTPLNEVLVGAGTSGLLTTELTAIWDNVPGGVTGGSLLAADTMDVSVALVQQNAPAVKAALDKLTSDAASAALSGALGSDPAAAFATAQALFEPISFLQVAALQAVGTPLNEVLVGAGTSGLLTTELTAIWDNVPGGVTGGSPLAADTMDVSVALVQQNAPAVKAALDKLTSDAASAALSGALGSDPAVAFATAQALFEPISFLQVVALQAVGTPLNEVLVGAGTSGLLTTELTAIWDNVPGGVTGGSPLAADTMDVSVALVQGDVLATVTALNNLFNSAVTAAATPGGGLDSSALLTILTAAGAIESLVVADPTSTSISAPDVTYGAAGSVTVTVGSTSGTPSGNVTLAVNEVNGTQWITQTLVGGAATFSLPGLNAGDYGLTAFFAAQGGAQGSSFSSGNLHVNKAALTVTVTGYTGGAYDGQAHTQTVTVTGADNSVLYTTSLTGTNAGSYSLPWSFSNDNYQALFESGTLAFSIAKAHLTVTANNQTRTFGAANPVLTATLSGFVHGEGPGVVSGAATLSTTATVSSPVGTDPITVVSAGTLAAVNYDFPSNLFGSGTLTITLPSSGAAAYVLNGTTSGAVTASGNATVTLAGGLYVDSSSASAISASGNARVNVGGTVQVVGGVSKSGNASATKTGTPTATSDPLAGLPLPGVSGLTNYGAVSVAGNSSKTLSPGIYTSIQVSGNASVTLSNSGSSIYVIEGGGLSVSGNASLSGSGVLIFNAGSSYNGTTDGGTYGSITLGGNGTISLSGPTSGPYAGVVIFQSRSNTKALSLGGNGTAGITSTLYAPSANAGLSGNAEVNGTLIVSTLTVSGNAGAFELGDGASSDYVASTNNWITDGVLTVAVEDDAGNGITSDELNDVSEAMTYLNQALGQFGVNLSWAAAGTNADVHVHFATTSPEGDASAGVLGFTTASNDVYLVEGWNWYTGDDSTQIGAGQYDFLTLTTHELAHTVGLGESVDPSSVLYEYLAPGTVRRTFTDSNLSLIDTNADRFMKAAQPAVPATMAAALSNPFTVGTPALAIGLLPAGSFGWESALRGSSASPKDGHVAMSSGLDRDDSVLMGGAASDLVISGQGRNLMAGVFGLDGVAEDHGAGHARDQVFMSLGEHDTMEAKLIDSQLMELSSKE